MLRFIDQTEYRGYTEAPPYPTSIIDNTLLVEFYRWLDQSYSTHTTATYLAALKRFLVWLDAADRLPATFQLGKAQSQLKAVQGKQKQAYRHRRPDPELPRIVTYYDELTLPSPSPVPGDSVKARKMRQARLILLRNRALLHTLYASAGRVSEICGLTRQQVLDGRIDEVHLIGKGEKERVILLTAEAQAAIRAYLKERLDTSPYLFIGHGRRSHGQALNRTAAWKVVKAVAKELELHHQTSPHTFRHYRATQLLNEGMSLELVQAYLGHESIETTRRIYAHTHTTVLKQQFKTYDRSPEEALQALQARSESER